MRIDPILDAASRRINLALPSQGNPQARTLAKQLFAQSGSDPVRYMQAIERWINQTEFRYTLSPPRLNTNRIDEFYSLPKQDFVSIIRQALPLCYELPVFRREWLLVIKAVS